MRPNSSASKAVGQAVAIILLLLHPSLIVAVDPASCSYECARIDSLLSQCLNDAQSDSSKFAPCFCAPSSVSSTKLIEVLNGCVVCNVDNVGAHPLAEYQAADVVCQAYDTSGAAAANEIVNKPLTQVVEFFSASVLPLIRSAGPAPTPGTPGPGPAPTSRIPATHHQPQKTTSMAVSMTSAVAPGPGPGGFSIPTSTPTVSPATVPVATSTSTSTGAAARFGPGAHRQLGLFEWAALGLMGFLI